MIIWRGLGILVPVIAVAAWISIPEAFKAVLSAPTYASYYKYISAFSLLLSALAIWFLGRKLNTAGGRALVDEKTGERVILRANHALFFINMEYWAVALVLLIVYVLFT